MKVISLKKNLLRSLLAVVMVIGFVSCAEDPDNYDIFIGSYHGRVSYTEPANAVIKTSKDGKVTIMKVGTRHDFHFSDGIPSINGIAIEKTEGRTFKASIVDPYSGYILIEDNKLDLKYIKGLLEATWTANCERK